jgi:hypothetical protein
MEALMTGKEKLLNIVNLSYPPLARTLEASSVKNDDDRIGGIIEYYKNRTEPAYLFDSDEPEKFHDGLSIKEAEEVINRKIFGYQFDGEIDWTFNPTAETSRDNEWSWSLYRNIYWQPLARAYAMTGDEKYAREFICQMKSFTAAWPVEPFMEDPEYAKKFVFPGHPWRHIETAIRIYTTWLPCYMIFRRSPSWDREGWLVFLNQISDHAEYLMTHYTNHERSSNWLTMESGALLQMGIMFPEMKNAPEWKLTGYRRVTHEIKYSFDNDGIHMERTPVYHLVAALVYFQALRLCELNNIPIPPYGPPVFVKAAEFLLHLVKPDFSTPMIGDADREDLLARKSDESVYEGMNLSFDPLDMNEIRAFFKKMADFSGREDFLWAATGRKSGHEPEKRNFAWKDAGIYVMRTGWSAGGSYMLVHGVQLERGEKSTHSHNDTGHLELSIRGEDVLVDCGRYIYNSSCWKDWRHYFTSAVSHNTLFVDDHTMGTVPGVTRVRGVRTHCHEFTETGNYQLIDISHNGYAFMDDPVFHRRRVIRLAGDVFIIDDRITGPGLSKHDFRLYFNFAPGKLEALDSYSCKYRKETGTGYFFTSIVKENFEMVYLNGSTDPKGGWISYGYSERKPIPQLYIASRGPAPLRFISAICPSDITVTGSGDLRNARMEITGLFNYRVEFKNDDIILS